MKEKLKKKFDSIYWAQTYEIRRADIIRLPTISIKSQWPLLFTEEGVIVIFYTNLLVNMLSFIFLIKLRMDYENITEHPGNQAKLLCEKICQKFTFEQIFHDTNIYYKSSMPKEIPNGLSVVKSEETYSIYLDGVFIEKGERSFILYIFSLVAKIWKIRINCGKILKKILNF